MLIQISRLLFKTKISFGAIFLISKFHKNVQIIGTHVLTCSHVNAPEDGRQCDADDEGGEGDADRHLRGHADDDDLTAGPGGALTRCQRRTRCRPAGRLSRGDPAWTPQKTEAKC